MKTIIKNKRSYRTKIGCSSTFSTGESEPVQEENSGNQVTDSASDDEAENGDGNGDFSNSDKDENKDENPNSAGPAGMKRKVMERVGNGKR